MFEQCTHDIAMNNGLIASLFLAGLVGGATHCAGMCSPFVLAQVKNTPETAPVLQRIKGAMLIPYHLGRMTTYIGLAVILGATLNLAFMFQPIRTLVSAPLLAFAGTIFLITAFPQLGVLFPWAGRLRIAAPYRWIMRGYEFLRLGNSSLKRYFLGILLGFMPCGLVASAVLAAGAAGSLWASAAAMAAFTLGTVPALLGVALGGHVVKARYPKLERRLTQGLMACSALWLFVLAGQAVF